MTTREEALVNWGKLRSHLVAVHTGAADRTRPDIGWNIGYYWPVQGTVDYSGHECGTACCLAGHALIALRGDVFGHDHPSTEASQLLGLERALDGSPPVVETREDSLFAPPGFISHRRVYDLPAAIRMCDRVLAGEPAYWGVEAAS